MFDRFGEKANLNVQSPTRIVFLRDGIVKIGQGIIRLFAGEHFRLGWFDVFDALIALRGEVEVEKKLDEEHFLTRK